MLNTLILKVSVLFFSKTSKILQKNWGNRVKDGQNLKCILRKFFENLNFCKMIKYIDPESLDLNGTRNNAKK